MRIRRCPATVARVRAAARYLGSVLAAGALTLGCGRGSSAGTDTFTAAFQGSGAGEGIDPGVNTLFIDEARMKAVYDGLFEVDGSMTPISRPAESAEPNADGTRWRIALRTRPGTTGGSSPHAMCCTPSRGCSGPRRSVRSSPRPHWTKWIWPAVARSTTAPDSKPAACVLRAGPRKWASGPRSGSLTAAGLRSRR